jgi:hypothetical protein
MGKYELTKRTVIEQWAVNYPKVMTWLSKLQKKGQAAWFLWLYCTGVNRTPDNLLALKEDPRSREAEYLLDKFVSDNPLSLPNSLMVNASIATKSFYRHNYSALASASGTVAFIKLKPYRRHSKEELLKIYRSAQNPRDRSLVTFAFSTAIAAETLTKVQWKHLEPHWETRETPYIGLPSSIIKGHGIGKYAGVEQHTFLTPEAKRDLIEYKDWLERIKGLHITPEDYVFVELHPPYKSMAMSTLSKVPTQLSKRSGVGFSWHDARRYVETALEEIRIHPNWARKIRGRKVRGEEAPYSRPAVEQLRSKYLEAVPLLEFTQPTQLIELQKRQEAIEQIVDGLSVEQKELMRRHGLSLKSLTQSRRPKKPETMTNGGDCAFKEIGETELLSHLQAGWTVAHKLSDGQIIVKR